MSSGPPYDKLCRHCGHRIRFWPGLSLWLHLGGSQYCDASATTRAEP